MKFKIIIYFGNPLIPENAIRWYIKEFMSIKDAKNFAVMDMAAKEENYSIEEL